MHRSRDSSACRNRFKGTPSARGRAARPPPASPPPRCAAVPPRATSARGRSARPWRSDAAGAAPRRPTSTSCPRASGRSARGREGPPRCSTRAYAEGAAVGFASCELRGALRPAAASVPDAAYPWTPVPRGSPSRAQRDAIQVRCGPAPTGSRPRGGRDAPARTAREALAHARAGRVHSATASTLAFEPLQPVHQLRRTRRWPTAGGPRAGGVVARPPRRNAMTPARRRRARSPRVRVIRRPARTGWRRHRLLSVTEGAPFSAVHHRPGVRPRHHLARHLDGARQHSSVCEPDAASAASNSMTAGVSSSSSAAIGTFFWSFLNVLPSAFLFSVLATSRSSDAASNELRAHVAASARETLQERRVRGPAWPTHAATAGRRLQLQVPAVRSRSAPFWMETTGTDLSGSVTQPHRERASAPSVGKRHVAVIPFAAPISEFHPIQNPSVRLSVRPKNSRRVAHPRLSTERRGRKQSPGAKSAQSPLRAPLRVLDASHARLECFHLGRRAESASDVA